MGDSHVSTYRLCNNTRIHLIDENLSIQNLKEYNKEILRAIDSHKHEPWLLIIGERDCRKHMFIESVQTKEPLDDIINRYATRLVRFLSTLGSTYTVYGTSVSPTGNIEDIEYEYLVPREVRQVITAKYNARLQILSRQANVPYLNIWKIGAAPKDVCPLTMFEADKCHIKAEKASETLDLALKSL